MDRTFRRIAVYCGSSTRVDAAYLNAAREVGRGLAQRGIGVVYGGGRVGLMGELAEGALAEGGEVIGVITEKLLDLEVGHEGLSELFVTQGMQSRKTLMSQLADAFIALPGGWGTLDEFFEAATWAQLNHHMKPVGLLNIREYYNGLIAFLMHAEREGFVRPSHANMIQVGHDLSSLLDRLARCEIPRLGAWKP
ncbi:MAG: TIGR00730 family Rossman fold protein [Deltaproteobacteria bacterium]|nr:MAG: TIGR00730 family Rossman fold protein [Deltaproteobacteria bacterium]